MAFPMLQDAQKVVDALRVKSHQKLPPEILKLDNETVSIVIDIDGKDYIFTMMAIPKPRQVPTSN